MIQTLNTRNGGISVRDVGGQVKLHTLNGGVSLTNVNGDIRGDTKNGGVTIALSGDHWDGQGLEIETHNGGINIDDAGELFGVAQTSTPRSCPGGDCSRRPRRHATASPYA